MNAANLTILISQALFCVIQLYFLWRTAGYVNASAARASSLKEKLDDLGTLKRRMDVLESDMSDKFDFFVKRTRSRDAMRAKRDESEDSNTPSVLVPV